MAISRRYRHSIKADILHEIVWQNLYKRDTEISRKRDTAAKIERRIAELEQGQFNSTCSLRTGLRSGQTAPPKQKTFFHSKFKPPSLPSLPAYPDTPRTPHYRRSWKRSALWSDPG